MSVFGLMLLVYHTQFMNHPQMSRQKSLKIYPKAKVQNFHLLASAIIQLNFVHTNERSISLLLKTFDWMEVSPLCFCARNFVP